MKKSILAASLLVAGGLALSPQAKASFIVTLTQVGSNVVATGSGSFDLTGLASAGSSFGYAVIEPDFGTITLGPGGVSPVDLYTGFTGPGNFGTGGVTAATTGSGNFVGIDSRTDSLGVPQGYVSGTALSDSTTWDNATFASLGATPGTYVWKWGSGADADSFTLDIGTTTAVPEPGSLLLLGTALTGLLAVSRSRRHRA